MPIDPKAPFPVDPHAVQVDRAADLSRRAATLERSGTKVTVGDGPPVATFAPDGTLYVDRVNLRLWVRINADWRYIATT